MFIKQKSLRERVEFKGRGLHTGKEITMSLLPSDVNTGIVFRRVDLDSMPEIKALAINVVSTQRGTVISDGVASVSTIEHLMSLFFALEIDNVLIEIDGPEVPIMDGSSYPFYQKLNRDYIIEQDALANVLSIDSELVVEDGNSGSKIRVIPAPDFSVDIKVDFNSIVLGEQSASFDNTTDYFNDIAKARTFVFLHDLEPLINNNLIKGGDLDNAIVIVEREVSKEYQEKLNTLFGKRSNENIQIGYLNAEDLNYPNECARHKLLDLLGDLYLSGYRINAKVEAYKPGHKINVEIAKKIISWQTKKHN